MKLLYVNIPTGTEDSEFGDFAKNAYVPLMRKNIGLVKSPETEIVFRFCEWGMGPIDMAFYRYIDHLASRMVYYAARNAKEEGFDAVVINCFGDPMLWELRQALCIPVIGIGESAMLHATLMGYKFGIVHISPYNIPETEEHLAKYGLKDRCIGQRPIDSWNAGLEDGLTQSDETVKAFVSTARKLIDDGAEVVIPGCSLMSPTMRLTPGAENLYPGGLTEVEGVPVVDVLSVTVKMAETMAALYRTGSGWISRKQLFAQPPQYVKDMSMLVTEQDRFKFWDVKY
jgi:Asp/Glu/hydantoin racemase